MFVFRQVKCEVKTAGKGMVVRDVGDETVTIVTVVVVVVTTSSGSHLDQSWSLMLLTLVLPCHCCTAWALASHVGMVVHVRKY